jgi:hypothetical protein
MAPRVPLLDLPASPMVMGGSVAAMEAAQGDVLDAALGAAAAAAAPARAGAALPMSARPPPSARAPAPKPWGSTGGGSSSGVAPPALPTPRSLVAVAPAGQPPDAVEALRNRLATLEADLASRGRRLSVTATDAAAAGGGGGGAGAEEPVSRDVIEALGVAATVLSARPRTADGLRSPRPRTAERPRTRGAGGGDDGRGDTRGDAAAGVDASGGGDDGAAGANPDDDDNDDDDDDDDDEPPTALAPPVAVSSADIARVTARARAAAPPRGLGRLAVPYRDYFPTLRDAFTSCVGAAAAGGLVRGGASTASSFGHAGALATLHTLDMAMKCVRAHRCARV